MMPQSPEEMAAAIIANMPEKTGRPIEHWLAIAKKSGLSKHGQIITMLKADHGLTHGYANVVAIKHREAAEGGPASPDELIEAQYAGAKAGLRPIYDAIMARVLEFGPDVEVIPRKAYASLRRSTQFGLVQPSTKTRVDLGLKLPDEAAGTRLEASGSFSDMVTHRVRVSDASQVDDELIGWLRNAYERA
ncbi:MAG: DUF4287 domain-containing protein [Planctomycetota bacterium]